MTDPAGAPDDSSGVVVDDGQWVAAVVGQLADTTRRRALAAIELGATTSAAVAAAARLSVADTERALARLASAGLVRHDPRGLTVDETRFQAAGRALLARPPRHEHDAEPPEGRKVLDAFVRGGRITTMPVAAGKRRVVLEWVARRFEPGRHYPERDVNTILGAHFDDVAALRRYLVDDELLDRAGGEYWRAGGPVDVGHVATLHADADGGDDGTGSPPERR